MPKVRSAKRICEGIQRAGRAVGFQDLDQGHSEVPTPNFCDVTPRLEMTDQREPQDVRKRTLETFQRMGRGLDGRSRAGSLKGHV